MFLSIASLVAVPMPNLYLAFLCRIYVSPGLFADEALTFLSHSFQIFPGGKVRYQHP